MSETERKRLIVKGPGGFQKAVGWINMPPKGAKGGGSRKKKTGSVTQGQTFDTREMEGQVQEGVHTWSEAGGAMAPWYDDSSKDEPIVKPSKGIRSSKKRKKGEMETEEGAVGGAAALGAAEAAIGGTAEGGVEVGGTQGSRGTRSEKRVRFAAEQEKEKVRKGKDKAIAEEEEEASEGELEIDPPRVQKGSNQAGLLVGESVKVFRELKKVSRSTTLTERMAAHVPADIKRFAEDGVIQVPVGLLSTEEHTINGKRVAFNPREIDKGGVEAIAVRIRANGFDTEHFTLTGIIRVSVKIELFLRKS
jgi:hypothetical protein